jgi:hypothetical protein
MPIDPRDNASSHLPHEAATLLAAAILRLHQRAALTAKESPESPTSSLDAGKKTVLLNQTGS